MSQWELLITVVGGAICTGCISAITYVFGRLGKHDERITVLETRMSVEFVHIEQAIAEIKRGIERLQNHSDH